MCLFLVQGCKKEQLIQKEPPKSDAEIQKISFDDFKRSVNLNKLGLLKQKFEFGSGKMMSISNDLSLDLAVNTESVQKLTTKDGVSYIFTMPLISPRAVEFSNLTIQVNGDKTIAFITTYTPTKAWNEAHKKKQIIPFEGDVTFMPIGLESLNLKDASSSVKANPGEKIMSASNKTMNRRACTAYYLYDYVPYGCSSGNHMPGDPACIWNDPYSSVPAGEYRAGYHVIPRSYQICEDGVQSPVGSSGGGGGGGGADGDTSPYTPGNYNPCDEPPLDGSTRKKNTPCDNSPSPDEVEQIMASELLIKILSINDNRRLQFINDPVNAAIVNDFLAYIANNGKTSEAVDFLNWAVGYLTENSGISFKDFKSEYLDYTLNPGNTNDVAIINNGIEIEDAPTTIPNSPKPIIGSTTNRNNTEDMTYSTNHDASGVNPQMLTKSNATLFISMKNLISVGTTRDGELRQVALDFIDIFRNNSSINTIASNPILNKKVEVSAVFANFVKAFGAELQTRLKQTGGDISGIVIDMRQIRPIFNGNYNMVAGLTILLNDTEQSTIRLESYDKLSNGEFIAVIEVTIMDHFGLDKHDVLSKQHIHDGFAAWWILQHNRGFVPFQTKIISRKTINGYWK